MKAKFTVILTLLLSLVCLAANADDYNNDILKRLSIIKRELTVIAERPNIT